MNNDDGKMVDKLSAHDVDDLDLGMPRILADLADGVLTVTVPKLPAEAPRRVVVS